MIRDGIKTDKENIRSFLMIGQSNMAGRGELSDVEPIHNKSCYMLRMGRWQTMEDPVNPDRRIFRGKYHSGVSLATSFADQFQKDTLQSVGLIPCADGGTTSEEWMPGTLLYDHAVMMTRLAGRTSKLAGILWHQGESNCNSEESLLHYKERLLEMMRSLRKDLGAEQLPLIIGEISEQLDPARGLEDRPARLNRILHEVADTLPLCAVVSSKGLPLKEDGIHFNAPACREFGLRYYEAYKKIKGE